MSLTREERELLVNSYAELLNGGPGFSNSKEKVELGNEMARMAIWSAMCHVTGRCGMGVDYAYPGTPQATIYTLLKKAFLED